MQVHVDSLLISSLVVVVPKRYQISCHVVKMYEIGPKCKHAILSMRRYV